MEQLPKIVRERLGSGEKAGPHPDADLLTAFAENSLGERERQPVLAHLSYCGECREVVALAQPELATQQVAVAAMAASPARAAIPQPLPTHWSRRFIFGWGVAAAACLVIASAAFFYQSRVHEKAAVESAQNGQGEGLTANQDSNAQKPAAVPAPVPPPPQDQLTAKLEAPPHAKAVARRSIPAERRPESRKDRALGGFAAAPMLKPNLKPKSSSVASGAGVVGGSAGGIAPSSTQNSQVADRIQVQVSGAEGPVAVEPNQQTNLPLNGRSVANIQNETVEVASAPLPPAEQKAANSAAATPKPVTAAASSAGFAAEKKTADMARMQALRKQAYAQMASNYMPTRWTISSDGSTLLRSGDQGSSWEVVPVASKVVFRAVASLGIEVWVAGNSGALYHSVDLGRHWTKVIPAANGSALGADIVSIEFNDPLRITLTTSEGKVWTTPDGGKSWQVR